ncbi:LmeA family phospholipid-binding protein [Microbacterium sp. JZ31]|uniref:LmeA family phospholipid-binding protein n=1 Tax=Microbacterium sp. JZ31 TaxID=1906274 RepID=UPI001931F82F|nr:DUF2993 domain-containing protein [Microbacterium sp. JZ31]
MEPVTARMPIPQAEAPRRRRGRGWIALVVVLIVVIALAVAAEFAARAVVRDQVRERIVNELALPADHPVDVGLEGIVLLQLAAGTLDAVRVSSDDVPVGDMAVDADVELTRVPVRDGAAAGPGTGQLRLDPATVEQLLAQSPLPQVLAGASVALAEPEVVLSNEFTVLGSQVPVELAVTPGAADGGLALTPTRATLGDAELSLDQLAAVIGISPEPTTVCIADRMPAGIALTDVSVVGEQLVAEASIAEGTLSDPALQQLGSCG